VTLTAAGTVSKTQFCPSIEDWKESRMPGCSACAEAGGHVSVYPVGFTGAGGGGTSCGVDRGKVGVCDKPLPVSDKQFTDRLAPERQPGIDLAVKNRLSERFMEDTKDLYLDVLRGRADPANAVEPIVQELLKLKDFPEFPKSQNVDTFADEAHSFLDQYTATGAFPQNARVLNAGSDVEQFLPRPFQELNGSIVCRLQQEILRKDCPTM
jgi:hypothetical protein